MIPPHICPTGPCAVCEQGVRIAAAIERAKAWLARMTPEQREAYFAEQRRLAVLAEMQVNEDATVTVRP